MDASSSNNYIELTEALRGDGSVAVDSGLELLVSEVLIVDIEIIPEEVQRRRLDNFKRIGEEAPK